MTSWTVISSSEHADAHWLPRQGYDFAAKQHVVEAFIDELPALLPHFACGFVKDSADSYKLIALLGLGGERNLFVDLEHNWLCGYVPAALSAYPFSLAKNPDSESSERILCISTEHLTDDPDSPEVFDAEGNPSSRVSEVLKFLSKCDNSLAQTRVAVKALDDLGVIQPWEMSISMGEGQDPKKISDLYSVDEAKLNKLDSSEVGELMKCGALAMAYAQLFSMHQIQKMDDNLIYLGQQQARNNTQSPVAGIFSEDEGSLNFDGF
jgi:hypothetical protein